jgi:putative transposase
MARNARVDIGGEVYHVLNRAVGRSKIFETNNDYKVFEELLAEAKKLIAMRVLAYVVMPNHWHLILHPRHDGDLGLFMHRLTNAHTRRVHADTKTTGTGPLYQGRYKAFIVQNDAHFLTLMKYVERNPVRAKLSNKCGDWRWGSAWRRNHGLVQQQTLIDNAPVPIPKDYERWIDVADRETDLGALREAVQKGKPFGNDSWVDRMVNKHSLGSTLRNPGRPKAL